MGKPAGRKLDLVYSHDPETGAWSAYILVRDEGPEKFRRVLWSSKTKDRFGATVQALREYEDDLEHLLREVRRLRKKTTREDLASRKGLLKALGGKSAKRVSKSGSLHTGEHSWESKAENVHQCTKCDLYRETRVCSENIFSRYWHPQKPVELVGWEKCVPSR